LQGDRGQLFYSFRVEEVVPSYHLARAIAAVLDLSWVRAELAPYYSSIGRPSIDPVLMIRMLIVGYVFAIRSERLLAIQARRAVTGNSEGTVEAAPGTGAKLEGRPLVTAR